MAGLVYYWLVTGTHVYLHDHCRIGLNQHWSKQTMRYAIKSIPNDAKHRDLFTAIMPEGCEQRRRARGYRFGKRNYHQSFPLALAGRFTQYVDDGMRGGFGRNPYSVGGIVQSKFVGIADNGKPRIRLQLAYACDTCGAGHHASHIGRRCHSGAWDNRCGGTVAVK
jgi:hypothetical protein